MGGIELRKIKGWRMRGGTSKRSEVKKRGRKKVAREAASSSFGGSCNVQVGRVFMQLRRREREVYDLNIGKT